MAIEVNIAGRRPLRLEHLLCDLNGTLTDRGRLLPGVREQIAELKANVRVQLLSADTYGTAAAIAAQLDVELRTVRHGITKHRVVEQLGPRSCVAIGNGVNDRPMLRGAALGIAVLGPEGTGVAALTAADLVCRSIAEALALLLDPRALAASLRV